VKYLQLYSGSTSEVHRREEGKITENSKKTWTDRSRGMHGGNPLSLGDSTLGGTSAQDFETPKA
jgi:hypothetical protein